MTQDRGQTPGRTCLGKIVAAHGVRGLVKILPFGDDPTLIESLSPVFTTEDGGETLSIELRNQNGRYWLAAVDGVDERNGAEALRGTELFVEKSKLPKIKEKNSYYYVDLVGLTAMDEAGAEIGTVLSVENYGAGELLDIKTSKGTFLIPFNKDNVPSVDMKAKSLVLKNYEMFMDMS